MYKFLIRPLLFLFDPETIHNFTFSFLRFRYLFPWNRWVDRLLYRKKDARLERKLFGLTFPNPVGLAAGFDKEAKLNENWENVGFGFVEVGTVTPKPQAGNPKQRLFRLSADQALINRMGFNSNGLEEMVGRLKKIRKKGIIIGGNIGKNKVTPNEQAGDDYEICFLGLHPYVDYFVVNVSSPNTPGLRDLQEKEPLTALLNRLMKLNQAQSIQRPILLKIAPDLTDGQLDDIIEVVKATGIDGLVATNTTNSRAGLTTPEAAVEAIGAGGLSGKPLKNRSTEVIRYLSEKSGGSIPIIGVGGICSPQDAKEKLDAGASLVQVYSGFVYEGPGFAKRICMHLLRS